MPDFKIIAKVTNRLVYDPHAEEVFRAFVFRSLNEDIYKYKEIDFDNRVSYKMTKSLWYV